MPRAPSKSSSLQAVAPAPILSEAPQHARITKRAPRVDPVKKSAKDRALAGTYRVIHGSLAIPRPAAELLKADGTVNEHEPKAVYAKEGDEVWLDNEDAMRALDAGLIEELDAKPSKVGKMWVKPPTARNLNAPDGGLQHAQY